jgi:hypothetical protein
MYIKLETENSRLGVKHQTSVDRSMSHLPPANEDCHHHLFPKVCQEDNHLLLGRMPRKIEEIPVI